MIFYKVVKTKKIIIIKNTLKLFCNILSINKKLWGYRRCGCGWIALFGTLFARYASTVIENAAET
jgi:hypothetical protein